MGVVISGTGGVAISEAGGVAISEARGVVISEAGGVVISRAGGGVWGCVDVGVVGEGGLLGGVMGPPRAGFRQHTLYGEKIILIEVHMLGSLILRV